MVETPQDLKLIVGLGNPGGKYEWTRHNLGFLVIRKLAEDANLKFKLSSLTKGMTAEGKIDQSDVCLLAPSTYMNNSGVAIRQFLDKCEVPFENILVVCDDVNLPFEQVRIRSKGSDGGHNGLGSIIEKIQTEEFPRLRLGVSQSPGNKEMVDYVLEEFTSKERENLDTFLTKATECCKVWLRDGINKAMEVYNRRNGNE